MTVTEFVRQNEQHLSAAHLATQEAWTALLAAKGIVLTDEDKALLARVFDAAYERILGRPRRP